VITVSSEINSRHRDHDLRLSTKAASCIAVPNCGSEFAIAPDKLSSSVPPLLSGAKLKISGAAGVDGLKFKNGVKRYHSIKHQFCSKCDAGCSVQ
jgi:hypothetical protein